MTMKTWTFAETHPKMPGPWSDEPDKAQWIDEKTNLDCLVVRNRLGALCGYEGQMRLFVSPASVELLGRYGWQPPVDVNPNGSVTLTLPVGSSGSSSGSAS